MLPEILWHPIRYSVSHLIVLFEAFSSVVLWSDSLQLQVFRVNTFFSPIIAFPHFLKQWKKNPTFLWGLPSQNNLKLSSLLLLKKREKKPLNFLNILYLCMIERQSSLSVTHIDQLKHWDKACHLSRALSPLRTIAPSISLLQPFLVESDLLRGLVGGDVKGWKILFDVTWLWCSVRPGQQRVFRDPDLEIGDKKSKEEAERCYSN